MTMRLNVEGLERRLGARYLLRDVSFQLHTGDHLVVFGPNGAGKTTLLRLLALLDRPAKGTIEYQQDGEVLEPAQARGVLGLLSHAPMLYPSLSARQKPELYAGLYGVDEPTERARELLSLVELSHRGEDAVRGFSRGMVQRMALARALVHDPAVLLLDEPFSGLDPRGSELLTRLLQQQAETRMIVEVSHNLDQGLQHATHVLLLKQARVALFGAKDDLGEDAIRSAYEATLQGGGAQ